MIAVKEKMPVCQKQTNPDLNISKAVLPKNTSGKISFWALAVLLVLIVVAGGSIYRTVDLHAKVRVALEESTTQNSETIDQDKVSQVIPVTSNSSVFPENREMVKKGDDVIPAEEKVGSTTDSKDDIEIIPVPDKVDLDRKEGVDSPKPEVKSNEDQRPLYVKVPVGRIRQEASMDAGIIARLHKGDRVTVVETSGDWYRIETEGGRNGWAHRMLFSKDVPRSSGGAKRLIKGIWVEELTQERGKIFIELDGYSLPDTLVLEGDRPRVACDFYGLHPDPALQKEISVYTGIIRSIRLGVHSGAKAKTRVVIDLLSENNYVVEQQFFLEENTYLLDIHLK